MKEYQDDARARAFASRHLGCQFHDPLIGIVIEDNGEQVGAVIFNGYIPGQNIDLTAVSTKWDIRIVRNLARYCFLRVKRVTARTCVTNTAAIKTLQALGFRQEGIMREYFPDGDAVVFGLLRSEQKLIKL